MKLIHHGAAKGVTGSCHELQTPYGSLLVDCGLFQGRDKKRHRASGFNFQTNNIAVLLVTHVHIDHVGRIPELVASGFSGPIYCTRATAALLPEVLEDAIRVGVKLSPVLAAELLDRIIAQLMPLDYDHDVALPELQGAVRVRFRVAGHILGSAFVEVFSQDQSVLFSGDLGVKNSPLLPDVAVPSNCDLVVIESTYGGRHHEAREHRHQRLKLALERSLENQGTTIIPAFSIGRTQELLYELEQIFAQGDPRWARIPVVLDSPLAATFTQIYEQFRGLWDAEAKALFGQQRHPLSFDNLVCIDSFADHVQLLNRLRQREESAIVIAAGGMCEGGRVIDFLRELLPLASTDVLFVGYQASGTLGRRLLERATEVTIDDELIAVNANISSLGGYSAHADEQGLVEFIASMSSPPKHIRIIHGEANAQRALGRRIRREFKGVEVSLAVTQSELILD